MSADEDTELRDLVAQSLESNGVLGKIKAQLRASVFLALEEQESIHNKSPMQNQELKKFLSTKDGRLVASLVREFLEFFKLDFSVAVFEPESGLTNDIYQGRASLAKDLSITEVDSQPLLSTLTKRGSSEKGRGGESSAAFIPKDLTPKQITAARKKFEHYDADKNGTIEKDELRNLFCDIFPGFHQNMIDRYVNDEFRAADTDLNNAIDFDEFLGMYKRLFVQCRSVVSNDTSELTSPRRGPEIPSRIPSPTRKLTEGLDETFSFASTVENNNRKNELTDTKPAPKSQTEKKTNSIDYFNKQDDDSFFDDPLPSLNDHSRSQSRSGAKSPRPSQIPVKSTSTSDKSRDKRDSRGNSLPKSGGFLTGAPPLNNSSTKPSKDVEFDKDFKKIDQNLADLGLAVSEDDYDDDFESSNVSPIGPTPRSARSDHNIKSIDEDIDEDISEDLSVPDDLLKSDNSAADDLTTDRTVSPTEQSIVFDYAEDIHLP